MNVAQCISSTVILPETSDYWSTRSASHSKMVKERKDYFEKMLLSGVRYSLLSELLYVEVFITNLVRHQWNNLSRWVWMTFWKVRLNSDIDRSLSTSKSAVDALYAGFVARTPFTIQLQFACTQTIEPCEVLSFDIDSNSDSLSNGLQIVSLSPFLISPIP